MTDSTSTTIITRFAPSPTGFLHIGGARTALFNWLFAKNAGGKMLLRIEDTDQARSTEAAVDAILDGLSWLGIDWDGDPISQASRVKRHQEIANQLLADKAAYRCYCTKDQVDAMRQQCRDDGRPYRHRCACRDSDKVQLGRDHVVRLKVSPGGVTVVNDKVKGRHVTPNKDLDDLVLLRSDQSPTYMLAVIVDDHDMGVTHIIRGVDHLTNAAKQTLICQALSWPVPDQYPSHSW